MLYHDYDPQAVEDAVNIALKQGVSSSGAIAHILIYTNTPERIIPPVKGWGASTPLDLSVYGQLGGVQ